MMQVVKAKDKDLVKLLKDFSKGSVAEFKRDLRKNNEEMLVLRLGSELVGVLKYKNFLTKSRIESFYVIKEDLRRKGFGQKLFDAYMKLVSAKSFIEAYVYASNSRALNFYEKNCFKVIKKTKDAKGEEMYYLKKNL